MTTRTFIKFKEATRKGKKPSKLGWQTLYITYESMQMLYFARLPAVGIGNVMRDTEPCSASSTGVKKDTATCRQHREVAWQQSSSLSSFHGKSRSLRKTFRGTKHQFYQSTKTVLMPYATTRKWEHLRSDAAARKLTLDLLE